jgi:hypothetical protein
VGAESVVEVAPQPPAFFLTCRHQSFPGCLQVSGQAHRVSRVPGLAGKVGQQPVIGSAQRLTGLAGGDGKLAHLLGAERQRNPQRDRARGPRLG